LVKYYQTGIFDTALEQRPFIVMEFIEGSNLTDALSQFPGTATELDRYILNILADILNGLGALHDKGIIHRDLQPKNILIRNGGGVLVDFGVSKHLMKDSPTSLWEEIGSRRYWAPECIEAVQERWFPETDIFMLASCFVHIISGKYLFHDAKNYPDFFDKLRRYSMGVNPIPEIQELSELSESRSRQIIRAMLAPFPDERPSAGEILQRLAEGTTPQIENNGGRAGYPLSEFLWNIHTESELRVVLFLGRLFDPGNSLADISLKTLNSITAETRYHDGIKFARFIEKLAVWGMIRQVDEEGIYFHNYGERIVFGEEGMFAPCVAAQAVLSEMDHPLETWRRIQSARDEILGRVKDGTCKHRHAGGFDYITFKKRHYIVDPCDHETWEYRLAVQEKLLNQIVILDVELERHRIHVEAM